MPNTLRTLALALLTLPLMTVAAERTLDQTKAKKKEVRHSMMGFRNTLLFYTFAEQQAVLRLQIDNKSDAMPIKASVYLFDQSTTADGLAKWLNNQHSDGLYPNVPRPTSVTQLPDTLCKVTHKAGKGEKENHFDKAKFTDYAITFSVGAHTETGKFKLKAFTDKSGVFVKK